MPRRLRRRRLEWKAWSVAACGEPMNPKRSSDENATMATAADTLQEQRPDDEIPLTRQRLRNKDGMTSTAVCDAIAARRSGTA